MADFFTRLSARTLGIGPIARPRAPTPYEAAPSGLESGVDSRMRIPEAETTEPRSPQAIAAAPTQGAATLPVRGHDAASRSESPPRSPALEAALAPRRQSVPLATIAPIAKPEPAEGQTADRSRVSPIALPEPLPGTPEANDRRSAPAAPQTEVLPGRQPSAALTPRSDIAARPARIDARPLPRPRGRERPRDADPAPTIQVTIGRVEVRAVTSPPAAARPAPRSTLRSLDDYLQPRQRK
jgi:hypothetical protein